MNQLPQAIGFSVYVWNRSLTVAVAQELRRLNPEIILFCGGPEVTASPLTAVFDFIIVGEGEKPFLSFCERISNGLDYTDIPGIIREGAPFVPPPPPLEDLDRIPSPYLTAVIDTRQTQGLLWQLSRGCSFTCDFCFDSRGIHGVRSFTLERIKEELRHFAETGVSQIFVLDSTFNRDQRRAKNILRMIGEYAPRIHFHFEVRSEFIDREMAELFAAITCSLQIGLQSADRSVLAHVGRTFTRTDFSARIGLLNESGATFGFDLIYGLPGDTLCGFTESLEYALSLYPNHLDIFPLAVLPGTKLAGRGEELAMRWNPEPPYLLEATDCFSVADMAEASQLAAATDIFYTRGRAVAWFNGVVSALGLKRSDVIRQFGDWLAERRSGAFSESDMTDEEVENLQLQFLGNLFNNSKKSRFLPLVRDLITYHHCYSSVLMAAEAATLSSATINAKNRFRLSATARVIHFSYDIDELLECGEPRLSLLYKHLAPTGSQAVVYVTTAGSIHTESLALPYATILEQLPDAFPLQMTTATGLTVAEINEFLHFALSEGIIVSLM